FTAVEDGGGVLLSWQTGYEVDNLGFNIYREVDGRRARINPAIVAGSALLAGPGGVLTAGGAYAWRDRSPGKKGNVAYWLEDIDLNGASAWHGPVTPQKASVKAIKRTPSATLDALNAAVTAHPATVIERVQPAPVGYKEHSASGLAVSSADAEPSDKQLKKQWELAARPAIKLSVREPGWYRVGQPELLAAGLPPDVDPHYFQLYADGRQQRILVTGERDRHFGPDDAIEFYGVGLDTPATDARTYWLIVGPQPGKRIKTARGAGARPATARNFPMTVERRERINYFPAAQNGDAENFFGRIVAQTPITQVLNLPNLDLAATEEASLEVALQGVTDQPGVDHRVRISLNGTEVGEMIFDGRSHRAARIPIPHRLLRAGENTISLAAVNSERDISLLDAIRITYRHTYNADDDALRFTATGGEAVRVGGFTEPDIRVIDITNPLAVTKARATVEPQGAGYAVKVNAPGAGTRTLMAFTNRQAKRAAAVAANRPSEWHRGARGADMVVIGHGDFLDAVQPLVAHRQSQGFAVVAADVEDLYDEFSYGARSPFAVKEFLRRSAAGKRPPRYVLFVGDASLDPRNYMGHGDFDFVPTKLMETSAMETASDDWFADFDGDELAEMAVGRLPARDAAEAARMAAKVVAYDQTEASGGVLLVADSQEGAAFEEANRQLRAAVPPPVSVREIFPSRTGVAAAKAEMIESINRGQMIVNYTGHSSVSFLRGNLLTVQDAPALANSGRLSLFVLMTCLSSYFHNPVGESLAEALMQAEG
ncbi:MAG TPA: C25 family cysteine peptidase, partial [Blastocatellia bacterium]|nr:C25 family cysteine peptidase [Blastocatellia bacterium]